MKVARETLMKTIIRCIFLTSVLFCSSNLSAQVGGPIAGPVFGPVENGGNVTPMSADVFNWMPGRMWFELNLADEGFGYSGAYSTLGLKTLIGEDILDGRWMFEHQSHVGMDEFNYFANFGIMRAFSLDSAGADVTTGLWFDYDGDEQGDFAHTFYQLAANMSVKTRNWDLVGNSYFPVGSTDFSKGDPTGGQGFFGNLLVLQSGIDAALQGYDATFRFRPQRLGALNGIVELGGYSYESELVDQFAGVRARLSVQALQSGIVSFEVSNDDRFGTTGAIQLAYLFGVNARGNDYSLNGRDMDPTVRNDHIIRFQRDFIAVVDPDTGAAYNVLHVDNTAGAGGTGSFESRFSTLAAAEAASSADDVIFVWEGDQTSTGYTSGITLKDGQLLLGDGVEHLVPTLGGTFYRLTNNVDGFRPTISGSPNAVTLANRNTVRGFNIDNSSGILNNGIRHGGGSTITDGIIEDVTITGSGGAGILLRDIAGDWTIARTQVSGAGFDGIHIDDACDPTSTFNFFNLTLNNNIRDGFHMEDYDGSSIMFTDVVANGNGRDGIRLERFKNGGGSPSSITALRSQMANNNGFGIHLDDFDGNVRILNSTMTGNNSGGVFLHNVKNTVASTMTVVGTDILGNTSTFTGNGVGAGAQIDILLDEIGAVGRVLVTNNTITGGGVGLRSVADNGTTLTTTVTENISIDSNANAGLIFSATGGSTHTVSVFNDRLGPLVMDDNGLGGGFGMVFNVGDPNGGVESRLTATVRNIQMNNNLVGVPVAGNTAIFGSSQNDGILELDIRNFTADGQINGMSFAFDNDGAGGVNRVFTQNNTFTTLSGTGFQATTGTNTKSAFAINNSFYQGNTTAVFNDGLRVSATGAGVGTDNRTFLSVAGSTFDTFDGEGMDLDADDGAHFLMNIANNTITNNGLGGAAGGATTFPFFDGVNITANDGAVANVRLDNNIITGNSDKGVEVLALDGSSINMLATLNNISGNDTGEDAVDDPIINAGISNFSATSNGAGTNICLAISNNFLGPQPGALFPDSFYGIQTVGAGTALLEDDFGTNGPGFFGTNGAVAIGVFSTVCTPAIVLEEGAFAGDGF